MRAVQGGSVLVAEEHGAVRSLYALVLREAGFDVVEAGSCQAAFGLAVALRPHAVIAACDSTLDGLGLAGRLGADAATRRIPVILLAGAAVEDPAVTAASSWVHTVLSKPCPRDELIEHVGHAVAYSMELRQILALSASASAADTAAPAVVPAPTQADSDLASPLRTLSLCPTCGRASLELLGETRHSVVMGCRACNEVAVQRRG